MTKKYHFSAIFVLWKFNDICLRPYWPQTASGFEVKFQIRVCHFCHLPEKCNYCFIEALFIVFENIPVKPTKFPFQCRITRLCSVYIAKMAAIFVKSIKIILAYPVVKVNMKGAGGGVKNTQRFDHVVYGWPLNKRYYSRSRFLFLFYLIDLLFLCLPAALLFYSIIS